MNIVITFTQPLTTKAADCFMVLLSDEVDGWGGFRGKKIAGLSANPIDEGSERLHLNIDYDGPHEGEEEIIDGLRDTLHFPGEPWGIGRARVQRLGRP
jgi:hypothetical protein